MKRFKKIYIEITNACNLSCSFCHGTKRETVFMTRDLFDKIAMQIAPYTNYVYLHVMGEPLLHPDLAELIDICAAYGLTVNLTTNGTLIKKWSEVLIGKKNLRQINFSLHDLQPLKEWESYTDDIFSFIRMRRENNPLYISLRLWNIDAQADNKETQAIKDKIQANMQVQFTPSARQKIADGVYLHLAPAFTWPDSKGEVVLENGFCYGLRTHVGILADGRVVPCCLDSEGEISLGCMPDENFGDIMEKESTVELLSGFLQRRFRHPLCKTCGYARDLNTRKNYELFIKK